METLLAEGEEHAVQSFSSNSKEIDLSVRRGSPAPVDTNSISDTFPDREPKALLPDPAKESLHREELQHVILRLAANRSLASATPTSSEATIRNPIVSAFEFIAPSQVEKTSHATPKSTTAKTTESPAEATEAERTTLPFKATTRTATTSESYSTVSYVNNDLSNTPLNSPEDVIRENEVEQGHKHHSPKHRHYSAPESSISLDVKRLLDEFNITDLNDDDDEEDGAEYNDYRVQYAQDRSLDLREDLDVDGELAYDDFDRDESDEILRIYDKIRKEEAEGKRLKAELDAETERSDIAVEIAGSERKLHGFDMSTIIGVALGATLFIIIGLSMWTISEYHAWSKE